MLCENCKKNIATTHIKTSVNGTVTEMHLCSQCALKQGIGDEFIMNSTFSDMLSSIFGDAAALSEKGSTKRCECCNSSFSDIVKTGKLGCSNCYETFFDELLPNLKRIHGSVKHIGKQVSTEDSNAEPFTAETADSLRKKLKEMIDAENYEEAAVLRDRIKALEEGEK